MSHISWTSPTINGLSIKLIEMINLYKLRDQFEIFKTYGIKLKPKIYKTDQIKQLSQKIIH